MLNNSLLNLKVLSVAILLALLVNLIVGGVLLPRKMAQAAFTDWIGGPSNIVNLILQGLKWVWQQASDAYAKAGIWVTAAIKWWEKADTWYSRALKYAFTVLKKKLLNMLVDDIVKWIQGGGKPKIVTDWKGFLGDAADKAGGQFVDKYLEYGFLCERFAPQLRFVLVTPPTFDTAVRCKLSDMGKNIGNFFNDFSQGGWKNWLQITETQGNIYGVYLTMLDQKIGLQSQAAEAAKNEGISSSGFLGDKVCIKRTCQDPDDPTRTSTETGTWKPEELQTGGNWICECLQWETRTPGKIVGDMTAKAVGKDIDWLMSSKEFSEYIGAILDAVINRTIKEGITAMRTSGGSSGQSGPGISETATGAGAVNLSAYEDAGQNKDLATTLVEQENLLKENLGKYLTEQQTTLGLLNQIKDAQNGSLTILKDMLSGSCSLPAGVTQTTLSTETTADNCSTTCPCAITTTETIKITAPGVGETLLKKTITQQKGETIADLADGSTSCVLPASPSSTPCTNPCISSSATTYQTLTSTTTAQTEIAVLNAGIANTQSQLSKIDIAITDMGDYQQAATNYVNKYEEIQRVNGDITAASSTEATMWTAKNKAIASTQTIINSSSADLNNFLQKVQNFGMQIIQQNSDIQTKRGGVQNCEFAQDNTYYKDLCDAQAKQTEYQNAYNACLAATTAGGGGG